MTTQITIGLLLILSSFFVGLREILLRPTSLHYRKAPFWLRLCLFGWLLTLFLVGNAAAWAGFEERRVNWEPLILILAASTAVQTAGMTLNLLRQRYHPRFWFRIDRLHTLAQCKPRGTLAMLEMAGFHVAAPREDVREFAQLDG